MIYLNRDKVKDKITACWQGKNIGGTLGTPYEGFPTINDIHGFASERGAALPNDDLDLQLIWLMAMDERGPENVTPATLGEYWLSFIDPYWNEYGVCQANLKEGFYPPMSGYMNNRGWKNSNGAWIRTEIWACLYPGRPDKAVEYAFADACVDHGFGEGTYAAMFVAAMESAAFLTSDIETLIKIGLSKIPENCRMAASIKIVLEGYKNGLDWKSVRNQVVEYSADLGWFQAPANVSFAIIGLLFGEGDYKKSLILAVNCGDDTDCSAATLGALMGIMRGTAGIPQDWLEYIGDGIISCSLRQGDNCYPKTCTELTDIVVGMLPVTNRPRFLWNSRERRFLKPFEYVTLYDGEDDLHEIELSDLMGRGFADKMFARSPYCFRIDSLISEFWIEYEQEPRIARNGDLKLKLSIDLKYFPEIPEQRHYNLRWILPEGWTVDGDLHAFACGVHWETQIKCQQHVDSLTKAARYSNWCVDDKPMEFTVHANDNVQGINRLVLEATTTGRLQPVYIPITIMG